MTHWRGKTTWLVAALYMLLTIVLAYPFSVHPASQLLSSDSDSLLVQWILAWDVHAFTAQPFHIFDTNIFAPLPGTLAYAENMIGSALLAAPVLWLSGNLVLALNVVSLLSIALSGLGTYLLARRLKASEAAAILAGIIYAFSPPRFFRIEQFQLTTIQWIPFCLAYLHAYLDEGKKRDLRLALGFYSLQALTGGHGAAFLTAAILALLIYRFGLGEPLRIVGRIKDMGVTGALLILPTILVFIPYRGAQKNMGLERNLMGWYTAPSSFFATPSHIDIKILEHFPAWLREQPDAYLFPGWMPMLIVALGLFVTGRPVAGRVLDPNRWWKRATYLLEFATVLYTAIAIWSTFTEQARLKFGEMTLLTARSPWRVWVVVLLVVGLRALLLRKVPLDLGGRIAAIPSTLRRAIAALRVNNVVFYTLITLICLWLLFGPPYGLWQYVYRWPVLSFIRTPTRFILLGLLGLSMLAAFAFDRLTWRLPRIAAAIAAVLVCGLCLIEFAALPFEGRDYQVEIPNSDRWLAQQPKPFTVAEVPMPDPDDVNRVNRWNAEYMLHATVHWQKTVHGYSGVLPEAHDKLYTSLYKFPSDDSVSRLDSFNVDYVVIHEDFSSAAQRTKTDTAMAPYANQFTLVHEEADGRVYRREKR